MARAGLDVGELLLKLVGRETGEISKVDYKPQKPAFMEFTPVGETHLERRTPESQGVSSAFFTEIIRRLSADKASRVHRVMFLRHGYVIAECSFEPFNMDMWHVSYSMCKSIVGMAIGILVDEGKLSVDDKLNDIFSAKTGPFGFLKKNITVENLLTMSSGIDFNEAGAISGNDWRKNYLESSFKFDPGTQFEYNSMNTYMLSAIITELTDLSCFEFCKQRIFDPLGIKRVFWESCPQSITKGGWGLFIRAEDMAKLGQLYLNKGKWEGKQIVPESWVIESTKPHFETGRADNKQYGYQLWTNNDREGSFAYNGMLGQNVFVYPDIDMVCVTNAGNADFFQTSDMAVTIRKAFSEEIVVSDTPLPEDFKALTELKAIAKSVSGRTKTFPSIHSGGWNTKQVRMTRGGKKSVSASFLTAKNRFRCDEDRGTLSFLRKINDRTYDMDKVGVGIFPIMMQIVHNNFTDGIHRIGFRLCADNSFYLDIYEGSVIFKLHCGFDGNHYVSDVNMHGEIYKVSVKSYLSKDEYNRYVLRNEISYLEEACHRTINICFDGDDTIEVRFYEIPGSDMIIQTVKSVAPEGIGGFQGAIVSKLYKGGVKEAFEHAVFNTTQPVLHGKLTVPEYKEFNEVVLEEKEPEDMV